MKKIIGGIIAILVVVMLVAVAIVVIANRDGTWTTPWEDDDNNDIPDPGSIGGEWGQEIIIGYADGNSESLKTVVDNPLRALSVNVGGQEVEYIQYLLKGKATGEGYTYVNVDISDYVVTWELKDGSTVVNTWTSYGSQQPTPIRPLAVDGAWHTMFSVTNVVENIVPSSLAPGFYTLYLVPSGSLSYEKDETWITADLPDTISFEVEVVSGGWLEVSFSSGYSVS